MFHNYLSLNYVSQLIMFRIFNQILCRIFFRFCSNRRFMINSILFIFVHLNICSYLNIVLFKLSCCFQIVLFLCFIYHFIFDFTSYLNVSRIKKIVKCCSSTLVRKYCLIFVYRMFIIVCIFLYYCLYFFLLLFVFVLFSFSFCYQARGLSDFCFEPNGGPCPRPFRRSTSAQAQGIAQCRPSPANYRERRPRPACSFLCPGQAHRPRHASMHDPHQLAFSHC